MRIILPVMALMAVVCAARGYAHHPVANPYRTDQTQKITGHLVELHLRNPHSLMLLDTKHPSTGESQRWSVEWLAAFLLSRQGIAATTLKAGDQLVITGYPSRNPDDRQLLIRTIVRPRDGWHWSGTFE